MVTFVFLFFFFQAEDGIRDLTVTGVQTCALPILLLAARGVAGLRMAPLLEPREIGVHLLQVLAQPGAQGAPRVRAGEQVFLDGQVLEAVPPLHHLADAALHQPGRIELVDALAAEHDLALRHLAALGAQQVRDGLQRGGLAGAVGAEQRDDLALLHLERHPLEHQDDVVVDDLDIADRQIRARGDHFSFEQSRGAMPFSLAYCAAEASTIGRTIDWSEAIQSVITFHFLPSHCRNLTAPPPSWSMHDTLSACISPSAPSSFRRLSSMFRCSIPQRTCSPVIGFPLPNWARAVRMASPVTKHASTTCPSQIQ